jgi:hypothetical protein
MVLASWCRFDVEPEDCLHISHFPDYLVSFFGLQNAIEPYKSIKAVIKFRLASGDSSFVVQRGPPFLPRKHMLLFKPN